MLLSSQEMQKDVEGSYPNVQTCWGYQLRLALVANFGPECLSVRSPSVHQGGFINLRTN